MLRGLLVACLVLVSPVAAKPKRPPPVAVEARFKERITKKLRASLSVATEHLAWVLGVRAIDGNKKSASRTISTFGLYELQLAGEQEWRSSCEVDIDVEKGSIMLCVLHKLQALTALCGVEGAATQYRSGVLALLQQLLSKRDKVIPGLGLKRALLPISNGLEAWLYEKEPKSGEYDISVAVQAAAMLSVVQCGSALGERELFKDVQSWFVAVVKVYPKNTWDKLSFHSNSILLESLVLMSATVRKDSSFAEEIQEFISDFESYLQATFTQDPRVWSFSGAHAAVLRWLAESKMIRKKRLGSSVDEYIKRWISISPGLNASSTYTCGPLQGVAPLLLKRGTEAAELVSSVLRLAEKDVDLFQINAAGETRSVAAGRIDDKLLAAQGATIEGAFLRDEAQLRSEKRWSLRIDDTAQCVIALTRTLRLVEDLMGVEVPEPPVPAASGDSNAQSGSAETQDPANASVHSEL